MGLFNGGLIGAILRGMADQQTRNAAQEWHDSFTKPRNFSSSSRGWECRFCGMKVHPYGGSASVRPSVKHGGECRNSPYGTHSWISY